MTIKNIVFDVGGVIIKGDLYHYLNKHFKSREDFDVFMKTVNHRQMSHIWDIGERPFSDVVKERIQQFPQYKDVLQDYDDNWIDVIIGEIKETVEIIKTLKKNGYKLYILSNFAKVKFDILIAKYSFSKYFDGIIISSEVKAVKPNADIYEILFSKFNLNPQECVFLDDLIENVEGAKKRGMQATQFTTPQEAAKFLKSLDINLK
jgi:epoxide hydrolase-like predicted phosphatase